VKPPEIDSMGNLAVQRRLSACAIDSLRKLEDDFTDRLYASNPSEIFTVRILTDFEWVPNPKNDYLKTDILNKNMGKCAGH
jgi:formylmethanofuran dehydrogenase subunit E